MFEDDLQDFPMATTGYLQKIRAAKRYQDIIAAEELFKVIVRAVQVARTRFSKTDYTAFSLKVDSLNCRIGLVVWALTRRKRSEMESMALKYGVVTFRSGNPATLDHSRNRSTLIRLIRRLRDLPDYGCGRLSYEVCICACGSFIVFTGVTGIS
jgi:hypothetical protein